MDVENPIFKSENEIAPLSQLRKMSSFVVPTDGVTTRMPRKRCSSNGSNGSSGENKENVPSERPSKRVTRSGLAQPKSRLAAPKLRSKLPGPKTRGGKRPSSSKDGKAEKAPADPPEASADAGASSSAACSSASAASSSSASPASASASSSSSSSSAAASASLAPPPQCETVLGAHGRSVEESQTYLEAMPKRSKKPRSFAGTVLS